MSYLASIIDLNIIDCFYQDFLSDPCLFVFESFKYLHECVDEKLSCIEECKHIVYNYDVIKVLDIWEGQAECSRGEFANKPTYLDFVFVPLFLEFFDILTKKYNINLKKDEHTGHISMESQVIPWHCIYFRNCFKD